jgi:hypothetical protein
MVPAFYHDSSAVGKNSLQVKNSKCFNYKRLSKHQLHTLSTFCYRNPFFVTVKNRTFILNLFQDPACKVTAISVAAIQAAQNSARHISFQSVVQNLNSYHHHD